MEVHSFMGLADYYRRFVEGFSKLAMLMTRLTKKGDKFLWTQECELGFRTLKEKLTIAFVLIIPSSGEGYDVYTDASLGMCPNARGEGSCLWLGATQDS